MKRKKNSHKSKKSGSLGMWVLAAVVMAGVVWLSLKLTTETSSDFVQNGQTFDVQTAPPSLFTGRARDAYQAARDVPEVLREIPCYCGCMQNDGHRNNLDCFTDNHGAT